MGRPIAVPKDSLMPLSMYAASVATFTRMLNNLMGFLDKAEAYATERGFNPDNLALYRLAPDMNTFAFQVQSATDRAKLYCARITGRHPPVWEDTEKTFPELRARIRKGLDYLATFSEAEFEGADTREVTFRFRGADKVWTGAEYLLTNAYPNFYFHVTTAYAILRHNGVPLGKRDFTG